VNTARALAVLGLIESNKGEHATAVALLEESTALARGTLDEDLISFALANLGYVGLAAGQHEGAYAACLEALEHRRRSPQERPDEVATALGNLGLAALFRGYPDEAGRHLGESLSLAVELQDPLNIAGALTGLGAVAAGDGAVEHAARLLGATEAVCARAGIEQEPVPSELYERTAEAVRRALGDEEFARVLEEGRKLGLEEATAAALASVNS